MKKITCILAIISTFSLTSCISTKMVTKTPQEVKMMTTKQFEANKKLVFKSAISLLQSESYLIEDANESVGLIKASKRVENRNASVQRILLGSSKDANTSRVSIYIEEFNKNLSEVKITLYEGSESTSGSWGNRSKDVNESMLYTPEIYNQWFNNLRAEIERRKALTE